MLDIEHTEDYKKRWPMAQRKGLIQSPSFKVQPPTPLQILDRHGLTDLSFIFFTGWLFTSILNRSKELIRVSLLPFGSTRELSVLVLYSPTTHLASPSRKVNELFDPEYFVCPLDRSGGKELSPTQQHLCPVVNKLRYNLAHARPDWSVDGLMEPDRTQYCCESKKQKLWAYLEATIRAEPEVYGPMVGGRCYPIRLPFDFLEKYLTGIEPKNLDLGKLLEETLLWFAMAASGVVVGYAHPQPTVPIVFNEIDLLLYEAGTDFKGLQEPPPGGWEAYLARHAVCLMEFTIGHHAEVAKAVSGGQQKAAGGPGKDVPKNKLMNFYAMRSFGFRLTHGNYFTVLGESNLAPPTRQTLDATTGFSYRCLSDECSDDIGQIVINHPDASCPLGQGPGVARALDWDGRRGSNGVPEGAIVPRCSRSGHKGDTDLKKLKICVPFDFSGTVNEMRVFRALSEMGSGGVGAMQQTAEKAIQALGPKALVALGIAFGVDVKKQAIGDILLSKQLRPLRFAAGRTRNHSPG